MAESKIDRHLSRLRELEQKKQPLLPVYQSLCETFFGRSGNFTIDAAPNSAFLTNDFVFDNTGAFAAQLAASIFVAMLWPDAGRTISIKPARRLKGKPGVDEYFSFVTDEVRAAFDNPKAGWALALMEHFGEQKVYGTSGIGTFEGPDSDPSLPVVFDSWGVRDLLISENAQGFVDTVYFKKRRTVRQIMQEYQKPGDKISKKVLSLYADGKYEDEIEILQAIEPKAPKPGTKGVAAMAVGATHIDVKNKLIMRESGFEEMPVCVGRAIKVTGEAYARSEGMVARPDADSLNALTGDVLVATEKQLKPPLAVLDDGRLGGAVVDTSPDGLTVFNTSGRLGAEKPIFPLYTVGEMQSAEKQQERFEKKIMQAFGLDRLLDLNNTVQMTAYETSVRDKMRGQALGSMFSRPIVEVFTPTVERVFNILWRGGRLGVVRSGMFSKIQTLWNQVLGVEEILVPEVVVKAAAAGLDIFEVEYISPAQRAMQGEKLQGIITVTDIIVKVGQLLPGFTDNFNVDKIAEYTVKYGGAPGDVENTRKAVTELRAAMAAAQKQAQALEAAGKMATTSRDAAQASAAMNPGMGK